MKPTKRTLDFPPQWLVQLLGIDLACGLYESTINDTSFSSNFIRFCSIISKISIEERIILPLYRECQRKLHCCCCYPSSLRTRLRHCCCCSLICQIWIDDDDDAQIRDVILAHDVPLLRYCCWLFDDGDGVSVFPVDESCDAVAPVACKPVHYRCQTLTTCGAVMAGHFRCHCNNIFHYKLFLFRFNSFYFCNFSNKLNFLVIQ